MANFSGVCICPFGYEGHLCEVSPQLTQFLYDYICEWKTNFILNSLFSLNQTKQVLIDGYYLADTNECEACNCTGLCNKTKKRLLCESEIK